MIVSMLHFLLFLWPLPDTHCFHSCHLPCYKRGKSTWWNLKTFMLKSHQLCESLSWLGSGHIGLLSGPPTCSGPLYFYDGFFFPLCKFHEILELILNCLFLYLLPSSTPDNFKFSHLFLNTWLEILNTLM